MADFGAIWEPAALGNYDTSRLPIDLIILHHTACPLAAALARFETPGAQVSAHFVVAQDGTITETVAIGDTAYHSGSYGINERSVGIEHESGPVGQDFFTHVQYRASAQLCMHIGERFGFPINPDHVWPHSQVVATACPGVLELNRIIAGGGRQDDIMAMFRNATQGAPLFGAVYIVGDSGKRHVGPQEYAAWVGSGTDYTNTDDATLASIPDASWATTQLQLAVHELAAAGVKVDLSAVTTSLDATAAALTDLKAHPALIADPVLVSKVDALSKHLGIGSA